MHSPPTAPPKQRKKRDRGVVLITVIFLVAAMSILVISIFSLSSDEFRASSTFAETLRVRQFADTAMRVVIGQLRQATTHPTDPNSPVSWVSQPGAIRTFPNPSDSEGLHKLFKLYSSREMIKDLPNGTALEVLAQELAPLADWMSDETKQARFVDLNEPVKRVAADGTEEVFFPIIDPRAKARDRVEGFNFEAEFVEGTEAQGTDDDRLPMPVEWIYVLRDGTLGALDEGGTFQGEKEPSEENPIVARLAFWTDDESCKINVNTASEAIPWDTPRCVNNVDISYAQTRPVYNEFQRYPGHPATTCLSSVLFPDRRASAHSSGRGKRLGEDELRQIYDLVPRVSGDEGGFLNRSTKRIALDDDRLYATFDELLFSTERRENEVFANLDSEKLERARFFLTANSKAPELNVFGRPRVSIWPIDGVAREYSSRRPKRTAFDQLIAFCSTIGDPDQLDRLRGDRAGKGSYFFYRGEDAYERGDWVPPVSSSTYWGFYGPGREAQTSKIRQGGGTDRLNHNYWLYRYILDQTNARIPGHGGSLRDKYGTFVLGDGKRSKNHSHYNAHVLPFLFYDQIISLNLYDTTLLGNGKRVYPFAGENRKQYGLGYLMPNQWIDEHRGGGNKPSGSTFRDRRGPTQGFGRSFTLSEVGMNFVCVAENQGGKLIGNNRIAAALPQAPTPQQIKNKSIAYLAPGEKLVQVAILPEVFIPSQGHAMSWCQTALRMKSIAGDITGRVVGDDKLSNGALERKVSFRELFDRVYSKSGEPATKPIPLRNDNFTFSPNSTGDIPADFVAWGGYSGVDFFTYKTANKQPRGIYSHPFIVKGQEFDFQSNAISLELESMDPFGFYWNNVSAYSDYPNTTASSTSTFNKSRRSLQGFFLTFPVKVPGFGIPTPVVDPEMKDVGPSSDYAYTWPGRLYEVGARGKPEALLGGSSPEGDTDVIRSLVVANGDYRITASTIYPGRTRANNVTANTSADRKGDGPSQFVPHPGYFDADRFSAHSLTLSNARKFPTTDLSSGGSSTTGYTGVAQPVESAPDFPIKPGTPSPYGGDYFNLTIWPATAAANAINYPFTTDPAKTRDFDNGTGLSPDGPFVGKADDGAKISSGGRPPYFSEFARDWGSESNSSDESFSPNRLLSSAVNFGSLPTLSPLAIPWTTLLFRPDITPGGHLGSAGKGIGNGSHPPDHMWLDLFWMPVVQPYAISQPFATAGKVNMNFQLFPFAHIERSTALHAALKSEELLAIPSEAGATYKKWGAGNSGWRHRIDADETLRQWEQKFLSGEVFLTESEICEQFLVPEGEKLENMEAYWNRHGLTGDNSLEKPYDRLYPRLCTRSNIYRVHMRVQTLKKVRSTPTDTFNPKRDAVVGEYRGSAVIERYIEPKDPKLPEYVEEVRIRKPKANAESVTARLPSLDRFYRYRVLSVKRFAP